jgi:hypothetical protein
MPEIITVVQTCLSKEYRVKPSTLSIQIAPQYLAQIDEDNERLYDWASEHKPDYFVEDME